MDPIRPIGPRTDVEAVERVPLLDPVAREDRRREREERRRERGRRGSATPPAARPDDAPAPREWRA
jgi:hypothetical protein